MWQTRRAVVFQFGVFVLLMGGILLLSRFFPVLQLINEIQQRVMQLGAWSVICYPLLFALCNLLLLPGGILCVGSGFFFGLWWGFAVVLTGNIIATALAFAISRSVGHAWFRNRLLANARLRALEPAVRQEAGKIIFLSQLHPLFPTSLITYFYGLTGIPFGTYMLWVTIGRIPGLFLYAYLGTLGQFGLNLAQGKSHPRMVEYLSWGGAFVVGVILLVILSGIARKAISEASEKQSAGTVEQDYDSERVTNVKS